MAMVEKGMHGLRCVTSALVIAALAGCGGGGEGGVPATPTGDGADDGVTGGTATVGSATGGDGGDAGTDPGVDAGTGDPGTGAGAGDTGMGADTGDSGDPEPSGTGDPLDPLILLGDDTRLLSRIPDVVETVTLADSGLRVAYTNLAQQQSAEPAYLEAQWSWMQTCTGVVGVPPLVVVIEGVVRPFVATDDVIRDITGLAQATTSVTSAGSVVQVSEVDFDESSGGRGFLTRAMLGRMLWIGDGLAERDYPFECARTDPADPGEPTDALSPTPPVR